MAKKGMSNNVGAALASVLTYYQNTMNMIWHDFIFDQWDVFQKIPILWTGS